MNKETSSKNEKINNSLQESSSILSEPSEREILAANITFFRKKAGLTQTGLADKLQYSNKNISKWEQGETTPDIFTLKKLADIFGITLDALLKPLSSENKEAIKTQSAVPMRWKIYMLMLSNAIFLLMICITWFALKSANVTSFNIGFLFVYMLPLMDISIFIFLCCTRKKVDIITLSLFGWLLILCFYISFIGTPNIAYIFIIGIGYELLAFAFAKLINSGKIIRFNKLLIKKTKNKSELN